MPVDLTTGNLPPDTNAALALEQIKTTPQREMILSSHELWAGAGQNLGGVFYHYNPATTTNTSFTYTADNAVLQPDSWQPLLNAQWLDNNGDCQIVVSAFVENMQVRLSFWDLEYGFSAFATLIPVDGKPQWIQDTITITAANLAAYGTFWVGALEIKKDVHETFARLYNVHAKVLYRSASDIPR
jgi:hypothetical protein